MTVVITFVSYFKIKIHAARTARRHECAAAAVSASAGSADSGSTSGGRVTSHFRMSSAAAAAYVDVDTWHRLDRLGPHEQFARGCASRAIRDAVAAFGASACVGVDFSAVAAATNSGLCGGDVPFIWSPFRIFSRSDFDGHHALECDGVRRSDGVLALCASDADFVTERLGATVRPLVVHPPLRESVLKIARAARRDSKTEVLDVRRARERRERAAQVRRAVRGTREARRF